MEDNLSTFFNYVNENSQYLIGTLREAVAIPSVSSDAKKRSEVFRMADWVKDRLVKLGADVKTVDPGTQELQGQTVQLPPVILSRYGNDSNKKNILVYGHYDVQPALKSDGWETDPFDLVETEDGRLVGRGSSDDKGPVIGWILTLEAFIKHGIDLPVNLLFCFEGMEESGSIGLEKVVGDEASNWFKGVDYTTISDVGWSSKDKPCIDFGIRGMNYFSINVSGPVADLHSGVFGGVVQEPMVVLTKLLAGLVEVDGKINIAGIHDQVMKLTEEEEKTYHGLSLTREALENDVGGDCLMEKDMVQLLMHKGRYPSLSVHGIEGAFYDPGSKTVIPASVKGKFSIRTVPNMEPETVKKITFDHVHKEFAKLNSKCKLEVEELSNGMWWYASPDLPINVAASKAMKRVYGTEPEYVREGGSIPITIVFQEQLKADVLLLPMGTCGDGAHSTNEKLDKFNYLEGIKQFFALLYEFSLL
ncbi:hypothetical protein BB559_004072 [Furculomyces boomerangus]|uniref:Peptidase M20 dimerisation domain-containing protein n=2 Tax=Harpellales TaxID=61421 RepID=A0A2T9YGS4_9FUNG|nr:hypothetical protein BB559_004072 [Furculomyces boomerangus]PWA00270.1 hypothetical protein BB558_003679 [Smittium angustum]